MFRKPHTRGFTLVEMLVVLAIVAVLLAIVLPSFSKARLKARDEKRIADLAQVQLALEVYFDIHGYYPRESDIGDQNFLGTGQPIDAILEPFIGTVPVDPLDGTSGRFYYYDGAQVCRDEHNVNRPKALLVTHMENPAKSNTATLCPGGWGGAAGTADADAYVILLGESSG